MSPRTTQPRESTRRRPYGRLSDLVQRRCIWLAMHTAVVGSIVGIAQQGRPFVDSGAPSSTVRRFNRGVGYHHSRQRSRPCEGARVLQRPPSPPTAPPVEGRAAISAKYRDLFERFNPGIIAEIDEIVVSGTLAYVRGDNRGTLVSRVGQADRTLNHVYLMLLTREEDRVWRIV